MTVFRVIACVYAVIVFLVAALAWAVDIRLLHSTREHMLPDFLLILVSSPASFSLEPLYECFPTFFDMPFAQLTWITLCGIGQVCVLFFVERLFSAKQKHISKT